MARPKGSKNKIEEKLKEPLFYLKILANDDVYECTGDDLLEMMRNFTLPPIFKAGAKLTAVSNKKTVTKSLQTSIARRIFNNHVSLEIFTRNLTRELQ